jgi:hypothetical protein
MVTVLLQKECEGFLKSKYETKINGEEGIKII